jgi:hypothetical protein
MMIVMSDACTINVLFDHNWKLIDDSRSVFDDTRVMLLLVASFTIVIYGHHIFIAQGTGFFPACSSFARGL